MASILRPGDTGYVQVANAFQKGRVSARSPLPETAYALGLKWERVQDGDEMRFAQVGGAQGDLAAYQGHSFDQAAGANLTTPTPPAKTTAKSPTVDTE